MYKKYKTKKVLVRCLFFTVVLIVVLVIVFLLGPRADRNQYFTPQNLPQEISKLDDYLQSEENKYDVKVGKEKTILWNDGKNRTEYSVVYLHGFTADRQEISPVAERVAQKLKANFFATRFTGHGIDADAYGEATLPLWLKDTDEAIRIGNMIGEKTIVIATSTGASLASLSNQSTIYANMWVSPNFHPKDPLSKLVIIPWGAHIVTLIKGKYKIDPLTNKPELLTSVYVPLMLTVEAVEKKDFSNFYTPTLIFMSTKDQTVSPEKTFQGFQRLATPFKKLVVYDNSESKNMHLITGDNTSPNSNELFIEEMYRFIKSVELEKASQK